MNDDIELGQEDSDIIVSDVYHRDALKCHHRLDVIKTLGEGTHGKVVLASDPFSMQQVYYIELELDCYCLFRSDYDHRSVTEIWKVKVTDL